MLNIFITPRKASKISYIAFPSEIGRELCLYNLVSVGDSHCSAQLYFGIAKVLYNSTKRLYENDILKVGRTQTGWEMSLNNEVTMRTVGASSNTGFICPTDFEWEYVTKESVFPANSPTLYQPRSECPKTCVYPRTDGRIMDVSEDHNGYIFVYKRKPELKI